MQAEGLCGKIQIKAKLAFEGCLSNMDRTQFFEMIMTICNWDASGDDEKVLTPLVEYLAQQPDEAIFAFDETMTELLFDLDTKKNFKEARRHFPHTDDDFLYSRCCALINGEEYYEKVKAGKVSDLWLMEFEAILSVPMWAWGKKHGEDVDNYPYLTAKSYETGSNAEGWK